MASTGLDAIREAAEARYGNLDIDMGDGSTVTLLNALRLPEARRDRLASLQDSLSDGDIAVADQIGALREMVGLVAATKGQGRRLLEAIGEDVPALLTVLEQYGQGSELGEA
ncbi:phage tail assembly protein [Salininema proteolyticum]|uniref:Phage tail assembly protein n=1 Tax=Salininema proteolyticum TaxID=1607685 RepID=A0ABV8U022_9ACTN